jgi:arabinogalactan endo-1,4-beta-galactosidase
MKLSSILAFPVLMGLAAWGGPSGPSAAFASDIPYAIGADLSFVKQQEDAGRVFKDDGVAAPGLRIFRNHGFGWVRLRLFHTPTTLPNSLAYTVAMARQAKSLGFRFLLDLHYSDTWADPGAQAPPRAWAGLAHGPLQDSVYAYTRAALARFAAEGAAPDMVQIGNEINSGLLWPDGDSDDFGKLADLLKAGIRGVDSGAAAGAGSGTGGAAVRPRIMLHIASGGDTAGTRWFFDNALARDVPFDAIGQSYYPMWHGTPEDLARNLSMMGRRYDKDIYVVETAFAAYPDGTSPFPLTDAGQAAYVRKLDSLVRATPNGRGKGWLWWEPTGEAYLGTPRGLFDKNGNARPALSAFDGLVALRSPRAPRAPVTDMLLVPRGASMRLFAAPRGPVRADGKPAPARAFPAGTPPTALPIPGDP